MCHKSKKMQKLEFEQVQRQTRQTVGKFDFERIVGKHALLCLSILTSRNLEKAFENGSEWATIRREWEDAILLSVFAERNDGDYTFEKAVRKVIGKFFDDCISVMKRKPETKDPENAKQVQLYSNLTCLTRRSIVEIQKMLSDYKYELARVASVKQDNDHYYTFALSFLYAANRLGYFLDLEMN